VEDAQHEAAAAKAESSAATFALAAERALVRSLRSELEAVRESADAAATHAAIQEATSSLVASYAAEVASLTERAEAATAAARTSRERARSLETQVNSYVDKNLLLAMDLADAHTKSNAQVEALASANADLALLRAQQSSLRADAASMTAANAAALTGLQAQLDSLSRTVAAANTKADAAEAARAAMAARLAAEQTARRRLAAQVAELAAEAARTPQPPVPRAMPALDVETPPMLLEPPPLGETPTRGLSGATPRLADDAASALELAQAAIGAGSLQLIANRVHGVLLPTAAHEVVATLHQLSEEASRSQLLLAAERFLDGAAWCTVCVASAAALLLVHREHSHGALGGAAVCAPALSAVVVHAGRPAQVRRRRWRCCTTRRQQHSSRRRSAKRWGSLDRTTRACTTSSGRSPAGTRCRPGAPSRVPWRQRRRRGSRCCAASRLCSTLSPPRSAPLPAWLRHAPLRLLTAELTQGAAARGSAAALRGAAPGRCGDAERNARAARPLRQVIHQGLHRGAGRVSACRRRRDRRRRTRRGRGLVRTRVRGRAALGRAAGGGADGPQGRPGSARAAGRRG